MDGREATQKLQTGKHIDLLFKDIVMPGGVNRLELGGAGAEDEARTTGSADLRLCASGQLHDGSMILSKPYRKAELARRLREALSTPLPH